jgi:hypothetical protein
LSELITYPFNEIVRKIIEAEVRKRVDEYMKDLMKNAMIVILLSPEEKQDESKKIYEKLLSLPLNIKNITIKDKRIIIEVE